MKWKGMLFLPRCAQLRDKMLLFRHRHKSPLNSQKNFFIRRSEHLNLDNHTTELMDGSSRSEPFLHYTFLEVSYHMVNALKKTVIT